MTLLPAPKTEIRALPDHVGVALQEETVCAHPYCAHRGRLENHHVVRRSETGGPVDWVAINGVVLLNRRKLCHVHHPMITGEIGGHRAWIRYLEGEGWVWYAPAPQPAAGAVFDKLGAPWVPVGPLKGVM